MSFQIAGQPIGTGCPPFVIAEMSGNHNQSLERALEIVEAAAKSGAHAIKLQTYTADTMTLSVRGGSFEIADPDSRAGRNLHDLYKQAYTLGVASPNHGAGSRIGVDLLQFSI